MIDTTVPMTASALPLLSWRSVARECTRYLPVWFVYLSGIGLLHASLANFPQEGFDALGLSRMDFVPTVLFPMAWVAVFMGLRIRNSARLRAPWMAWAGLAGLVLGVPAIIVAFHRPHVLTHEQLTVLFEASQFAWVGVMMLAILVGRGRHQLVLFFGVTFVYGLVLENTGIAMHFFFEPSFQVYLKPLVAPLCTMLGWCIVFYVTIAMVQQLAEWVPWLARSVTRRAVATTLLALSLDAQLDPLASLSGVFWRWNELLPPGFLGVPWLNFAAWLGAFLPYAWFVG
ncbi:MAG: hypothetical protein FJ087_07920, partial [Deltaproteobacteria bacterium]|nr:hypothetical protein [Deltaproteobacteria bacterium]